MQRVPVVVARRRMDPRRRLQHSRLHLVQLGAAGRTMQRGSAPAHTAHRTFTHSLTHSHKWAHRRAGHVSQPRRTRHRGSSSDPPPAARRDNPPPATQPATQRDNPAPAVAQRCATAATARCHVPRARRPVTRWQPRRLGLQSEPSDVWAADVAPTAAPALRAAVDVGDAAAVCRDYITLRTVPVFHVRPTPPVSR